MQKRENVNQEWADFIRTESDQAFHGLYSYYHDYLIYIAIRKGSFLEQAKDCVNDLFLYIFENRERLAHVKNHHNYLVTSFLRKLSRKGNFNNLELISENEEDDIPDKDIYPVTEPSCFDSNDEERLSQVLKDYISKLSYSQAKMIYQKFYIGLSYEEIATSNGVSVKTVYNTILQAIAKLRNLIGPEYTKSLKAAIFSLGSLFFSLAGMIISLLPFLAY